MTNTTEIPKGRLFLGVGILIIGFMSPLLIPLVTSSNWSTGVKATVSGLLAFGIPEVFMLIAVAVMGKQGYEFIKNKFLKYLRRFAPADEVSLSRYRIGLIMFSLPLLLGWLQPYLGHYLPYFKQVPVWQYVIADFMFVSSFFVLGGDFWDKIRALFAGRRDTLPGTGQVAGHISDRKILLCQSDFDHEDKTTLSPPADAGRPKQGNL